MLKWHKMKNQLPLIYSRNFEFSTVFSKITLQGMFCYHQECCNACNKVWFWKVYGRFAQYFLTATTKNCQIEEPVWVSALKHIVIFQAFHSKWWTPNFSIKAFTCRRKMFWGIWGKWSKRIFNYELVVTIILHFG